MRPSPEPLTRSPTVPTVISPADILAPLVSQVLPVVTAALGAVLAVLGAMIAFAVSRFGVQRVLAEFTGRHYDPETAEAFDPSLYPIEPARFGGVVGAEPEAFPDLESAPGEETAWADTSPMFAAYDDDGDDLFDDGPEYRDEWR